MGFIKKACISDNIAPLIDPVFAAPDTYTAASLCMATVFYAVQIYCDFSGYTDMAIAVAALLGFQLQLNFRFPYFASNIAEFWQRWHISLSIWLRDYLYIPLGGSRVGSTKTYRNLMITMLLGGLWHGAAWNFVIWGGLHGGALAIHRRLRSRWKKTLPAGTILGPLATFYWVCLTWIFFRCTSLEDALIMLQAFTLFQAPGTNGLDPSLALWLIPLGVAHWIAMRRDLPEWTDSLPEGIYAAALGVAVIAALLFVPADARPFIYFQF
ncbi:MAG: MBOAT family O-acyltransferase [Candidatus Hydrogenedentota bacterium]